MMYMNQSIEMDTIFGDGSGKGGKDLEGMLFSAGKRVLTGESHFMTAITSKRVSFAAPYPGKMVPFDLVEFGGTLIGQKDTFSVGILLKKVQGL